jgi:hypothetical protein
MEQIQIQQESVHEEVHEVEVHEVQGEEEVQGEKKFESIPDEHFSEEFQGLYVKLTEGDRDRLMQHMILGSKGVNGHYSNKSLGPYDVIDCNGFCASCKKLNQMGRKKIIACGRFKYTKGSRAGAHVLLVEQDGDHLFEVYNNCKPWKELKSATKPAPKPKKDNQDKIQKLLEKRRLLENQLKETNEKLESLLGKRIDRD